MQMACIKRYHFNQITRSSGGLIADQSWESTLRNLFDLTEAADCGFFVEEAWVFDAIQQGDSGLVNAEKLTGLCTLG